MTQRSEALRGLVLDRWIEGIEQHEDGRQRKGQETYLEPTVGALLTGYGHRRFS